VPTFENARAFAVHVFTASGAALALLALVFATGGQWTAMFVTLGAALIVDGADGPLARRLKVAETLPRWSGETLDLVVDFATYVFVPAYAIAACGVLPQEMTLPAGIVVVITGALYFSDRNMKTVDNYFRGFPAVWNLAAFYLILLKPDPWLALLLVVVLAGLSFAPIKFLHPLRVKDLRALNLVVLAAWGVLAFIALLYDLAPGPYVTWPLMAIAAYFFLVGFLPRVER
jgi:phosphatidylcholine synthase